jgi:hypothetical protein
LLVEEVPIEWGLSPLNTQERQNNELRRRGGGTCDFRSDIADKVQIQELGDG